MTDFPFSPASMPPFMGNVGPLPSHPKIDLLAKVLRNYDLMQTVSTIAGMHTVPAFQANAYRLELLQHIAVSACDGKTRPEPRHLDTWLNRQLRVAGIATMEDPAEDVFVSNVLTERGDFRVFPGLWESAETATTYLIAAVNSLGRANSGRWLEESLALLQLSDLVSARSSLERWAYEPSSAKGVIPIHPKAALREWAARVTFTNEQLAEHGIDASRLEPFVFDASRRAELIEENSHESQLHRRPLVRFGDTLVLAIPNAVTYAVRRHLVRCATDSGLLGKLEAALMNHAQARVLTLSTHGSRHGAELVQLPEGLRGVEFTCSSVVVRVGQRRFLHYLLISEDVAQFNSQGFRIPAEPKPPIQDAIWKHVEQVRDHLEAGHEVDSGHTFYIAGLLGGGFVCRHSADPAKWTTTLAKLGDLELLLMDTESPIDRVMLLLNQRKEEEENGLHMPFDNGLLNLYAYWIQQEFTLRVAEAPHNQPALVQIATDHLLSYRLERRRLADEHCERIAERYTVVQRANYASIYRTVRGLPIYVSMDLLMRGVLAFCLRAGAATIWVIVREPKDELGRKRAFQLWEALQLFVFRAMSGGHGPSAFKCMTPQVLLDLESIKPISSDEATQEPAGGGTSATSELQLRYNEDGTLAVLRAGPDFLERFNGIENKGEQYLLAMVLKALWSLSPAAPAHADRDLQARALQALGGTGARVLHALRVQSAADTLEVSQDGRVYGHPTECIAAMMNEAFRWRQPPEKVQSVPRDESTALLNEAVLRHATALQQRLQQFQRASLIQDLLQRYESLLRDKMRWRATARAVRSLYGAEDGTRAASESDQHRSQLQISLRALLEAATCECADSGGLLPDGHRIDELVARMMVIINLGRDSDVAHFGLASKGLNLYPNGSYSLDANVFGRIARPFYGETFGGSYEAAANDYESWFRPEAQPEPSDKPSFFDDASFQQAWLAEYGHSFSAFRQITGELEDMAVSGGVPVVTTYAEAIAAARADAGVTTADVKAFFDAFGLPRRQNWLVGRDVPTKAVGPWRFQRRLSLSLRPLIILDAEKGHFTYAIGMAREALAYVLDSIRTASFDKDVFESKQMRAWLGGRVDELGREFTEKVAAQLRDAGWHAKTEVKMTTLGAGKNPNLGDVDVLAWKDDGQVLAIECKRLKQSRTISEIALACERFRGNVDDKLDKHLRRLKWLAANEDKLLNFLQLRAPIHVRGPLVVNRPVPFKYLQELQISPSDIVLEDALSRYAAAGAS